MVDLSGPWPWLGLQSGFDALFPSGQFRYWKSRALAELSSAAIDDIADFAARRPSPLTDITVWHNGGAMNRGGETDTAAQGGENTEAQQPENTTAAQTRKKGCGSFAAAGTVVIAVLAVSFIGKKKS